MKFDAAAHRGQRSNEGLEGAGGRNVLILHPHFFWPKRIAFGISFLFGETTGEGDRGFLCFQRLGFFSSGGRGVSFLWEEKEFAAGVFLRRVLFHARLKKSTRLVFLSFLRAYSDLGRAEETDVIDVAIG